MPCPPEMTPMLCSFFAEHAALPHGRRSAALAAKAAELRLSPQTLLAWRKELGYGTPRRRRADAGTSVVPYHEAFTASTMIRQATRKNGKQTLPAGTVVEIARHNGKGVFGRIDAASGEIRPVTTGTVLRAMRRYGLHPEQIRRATPHVNLKSAHPNELWEIDASVCVLYKMNTGGLGVMEADEFYKNKPEAYGRIGQLVTRYLAVDHYSGAFYLDYFLGAESAQMLADFFIRAVTPREDGTLLHGVPLVLLVDPGVANKSHLFMQLAKRLDMEVRPHRVKNPRAKGAVESGHNWVERLFEGRLIFERVDTLEQLRALCRTWSAHHQSVTLHSRHEHARHGLWQTIRPEQLRLAPPAAWMYDSLSGLPQKCRVRGDLTVRLAIKGYGSNVYSVKDVPGVLIGEKLTVAANPYRLPDAFVVTVGAAGEEKRYPITAIAKDAAGFLATAQHIGKGFKSAPDTEADRARKAMDIAAYGGTTLEEAARLRRERAPAFGGEIDAFSYLAELPRPDFLRRQGTPIEARGPVVAAQPIPVFTAIERLIADGVVVPSLGDRVVALYPDGVPEDNYPALREALRGDHAPGLKVISG